MKRTGRGSVLQCVSTLERRNNIFEYFWRLGGYGANGRLYPVHEQF